MAPADAKKPGYVEFKILNNLPKLDDLWFMVGSRCNLECTHCYVESSPTNNTLQQITLDDMKPLLQEATEFGVENVYFTGGEPFINKDIIAMIEESLKIAPVTILTNATAPLRAHIENLKRLKQEYENPIRFRVSMDHYEEEKHDAIRGKGNFQRTLKNAVALSKEGFHTIITASGVVYENNSNEPEVIAQKFRDLFTPHGVDIDVKLLPFTLEMGSNVIRLENHLSKHVFISEACMALPGVKVENFQCHNGRTVQKIKGKIQVYPCPIIYNEPKYELATNLKDSFQKVYLHHKACFDFCYKSGGKCTN